MALATAKQAVEKAKADLAEMHVQHAAEQSLVARAQKEHLELNGESKKLDRECQEQSLIRMDLEAECAQLPAAADSRNPKEFAPPPEGGGPRKTASSSVRA